MGAALDLLARVVAAAPPDAMYCCAESMIRRAPSAPATPEPASSSTCARPSSPTERQPSLNSVSRPRWSNPALSIACEICSFARRSSS